MEGLGFKSKLSDFFGDFWAVEHRVLSNIECCRNFWAGVVEEPQKKSESLELKPKPSLQTVADYNYNYNITINTTFKLSHLLSSFLLTLRFSHFNFTIPPHFYNYLAQQLLRPAITTKPCTVTWSCTVYRTVTCSCDRVGCSWLRSSRVFLVMVIVVVKGARGR